jgi:hypothetical protein
LDLTVNLLYYPIVAVLLLALFVRRPGSEIKRLAILGWAGLLLAVRGSFWLVSTLRIAPALALVPVAAVAGIAWSARALLFPFRLRCAACGARLRASRVLSDGANLCERCSAQRQSDDAS